MNKRKNSPGHHGASQTVSRDRRQARRGRRVTSAFQAARGAAGEPLWLYGAHAVLAALANRQRRCHRLLLGAEAADRAQGMLEQVLQLHPSIKVETTDNATISALLPPGAVHQGIALQVTPLASPLLDVLLKNLPAGPQAIVALDRVTDPHNVGAVLRSAAAFGAAAVISTERHAARESGTLAKAASGALEHVPYLQPGNLARTLDRLKAVGFWVIGFAADAPTELATASLPDRVVLCLGAEGSGLRRLTRERCDLMISLPVRGPIRDLNVSNAAAVALYEVLGRRPSPAETMTKEEQR